MKLVKGVLLGAGGEAGDAQSPIGRHCILVDEVNHGVAGEYTPMDLSVHTKGF